MEGGTGAEACDLEEFFAAYYRRHPVNATFIGVHEYDHLLPGPLTSSPQTPGPRGYPEGWGDENFGARGIDLLLAQGHGEIERWEEESHHFRRGNPAYYTGEAIFGVLALFLRAFAPLSQRVESAIARMEAIPGFLRQAQETVRAAPLLWTERAIDECDGALAFFGEGVEILCAEEGIEEPGFREAARRARGAFEEFRRSLTDELAARPTDGYAAGPEGLDLMVHRAHFLDESAADIERYALDQLAETEAFLREHAKDFGGRSPHEALAQLADLHPTVDAYYQRYGEVWEEARETAIAHGLLTWPDFPIRYVPRPRWVRGAAPHLYFLFYRAPAAFDHVEPVEYLVTPIEPDMPVLEQERLLQATNDSVIKLNHVVHHGGIGHHVQNWHAYRSQPRIGQVAAVDCASRIAMPCGGTMAEGWATYATDLMDEIGFLTPLERYAHRHDRLRMAARAVVDVRLHTGSFGIEEAIAFYRDRIGMPEAGARSEAVKNSMFPGMALMYLMGCDQIHALRRELSARDPDFSLQRFHDRFLSYGSIPVALIAREMLGEARGV